MIKVIIIKKELKFNLKNFIIWVIVVVLFVFMYASVTKFFTDQNSPAIKFIEKFPENLLKTFNIDLEAFSKTEGIFGTEGMLFMFLIFAIYAIVLSSKIFAGEFDNKTVEYLFIKPINRKRIFCEKLFAIWLYLITFFSFFLLSELMFFNMYLDDFRTKVLFGFAAYVFVISILFSSISIFFSILFQKRKFVNSLSIALLFLFYFFNSVTQGVDTFEFLRKISVFHYLSSVDLVNTGKINYLSMFVILFVSLTLLYFSKKRFENQDILI